jgi:hypothetical protein
LDDQISNEKDDEIDNSEIVARRENIIRVCGKAVKQIDTETGDTIEIFHCIGDAYRKFGKKGGHISDACKGLRKTAFNFRWEYVC